MLIIGHSTNKHTTAKPGSPKLGVVLWVTLIVSWLNLLEQNLSSCVSGRKAKTHNKWRSRPKLWTFVQRIQLPAYTNSKAIIYCKHYCYINTILLTIHTQNTTHSQTLNN